MPLHIIRQDITQIKCDAIVNPTDRRLSGSGGADAAIHTVAGKQLKEHCEKIGTLPVGEAVITPSYNHRNCKFIIHTAGPLWTGGTSGERVLLRSCYLEALQLAWDNKCRTLAVPLISSGAYGFPKEKVLKIAMKVISQFLDAHEMDVYILVYDKTAYSISKHLQSDIDSFIDNAYVDEHASIRSKKREETNYAAYKENSIPRGYFDSVKIVGNRVPQSKGRRLDDSVLCDCANIPDGLVINLDKSFSDKLMDYIIQRDITNAKAYKNSNVSRKTFSKILCDPDYHPSKVTAVSFAIGLRLNLEETRDLLESAGMCLSRASKFDVIIEYFITTGAYQDIHEVNEVLYQYDQTLLGC